MTVEPRVLIDIELDSLYISYSKEKTEAHNGVGAIIKDLVIIYRKAGGCYRIPIS